MGAGLVLPIDFNTTGVGVGVSVDARFRIPLGRLFAVSFGARGIYEHEGCSGAAISQDFVCVDAGPSRTMGGFSADLYSIHATAALELTFGRFMSSYLILAPGMLRGAVSETGGWVTAGRPANTDVASFALIGALGYEFLIGRVRPFFEWGYRYVPDVHDGSGHTVLSGYLAGTVGVRAAF